MYVISVHDCFFVFGSFVVSNLWCVSKYPDQGFFILALQGFDEYMNLVLDDAEEVNIKKKSKKSLGRFHFYIVSPGFLLRICGL